MYASERFAIACFLMLAVSPSLDGYSFKHNTTYNQLVLNPFGIVSNIFIICYLIKNYFHIFHVYKFIIRRLLVQAHVLYIIIIAFVMTSNACMSESVFVCVCVFAVVAAADAVLIVWRWRCTYNKTMPITYNIIVHNNN